MNDDSRETMIREFVVESREHLSRIEPDLLDLETENAKVDDELINRIFRAIHSVKGASGFFNFKNINNLSHVMETILSKVRDGVLSPNSELIDLLLAGADRLSVMIEDVDTSDACDISEQVQSLSQFLDDDPTSIRSEDVQKPDADLPTRIDDLREEIKPTKDMLKEIKATGKNIYYCRYKIEKDPTDFQEQAESIFKQMQSLGVVLKCLPDIADLKNAEANMGTWEVLSSSVLELKLFASAIDIDPMSIVQVPIAGDTFGGHSISSKDAKREIEVGDSVESKMSSFPGDARQSSSNSGQIASIETLRVRVNLLNELLNQAGELVLARNQLMQILKGREDKIGGLKEVLQSINFVTAGLQENVMLTRMQPLRKVFDKYPRIVRDLARKLGKEIDIDTQGKDVELDKTMIEAISSPLTHLIRNTVDHGIELPADREIASKPRRGKVLIKAYHSAGLVNIDIIDDGRGMDSEVIKNKAIEKGLKNLDELDKMSTKDVLNLIFTPGFSTAQSVTEISGRGVGMDVVKTNIENLGGTVDIESKLGQGTRIHLRLPLTLAIIPSLLVQSGLERFAIPQVSIQELVRIQAKNVHKRILEVNGSGVLRLREKLLPLVNLTDVLGLPKTFIHPVTGCEMIDIRARMVDRRMEGINIDPDTGELMSKEPQHDTHQYDERRNKLQDTRRWRAASAMNILVIKSGNNQFGLVVMKIIDNEEIVVKSLSSLVKSNPCYAGATILGDGQVAIILDGQGIMKSAELNYSDFNRANDNLQQESQRKDLLEKQSFLLFRNGANEEFGLSTSMIARIERVSVTDIEKVGEKEFIKYGDASLRLIRLHDHLPVSPTEIKSEFVNIIVPKAGSSSIGFIADKVHDIVKTSANIDANNISDPGILGSAVINNNITLILDVFGLLEKIDPSLKWKGANSALGQNDIRILLVEDTPFYQVLGRSYLESAGYIVDLAGDGVEAMTKIRLTSYDMIITDIVMPNMDGFALIKRIRQDDKCKGIPVLALTSLSNEDSIEKAKDLGFTDFEHKIDKNRLLKKVHNILRGEAA